MHGNEIGNIKYTTGIKGQCAEFDGIDDYIELPDELMSSQYTVSMWVKVDNDIKGYPRIFDAWTDAELCAIQFTNDLPYSVNFNRIGYEGPNTGKYFVGSFHPWKNESSIFGEYHLFIKENIVFTDWNLLTITYDGINATLYLNGEKRLSYVFDDNTPSSYSNSPTEADYLNKIKFSIGVAKRYINDSNKNLYFFKGLVDEFKIYNRSISGVEVKELYRNNDNEVKGSIITASEILGYTASVAGATIKAIPYNLSAVTDIYGEFQLSNVPAGECILQIESAYFKTLTQTIQVNVGNNNIETIEIYKPKCQDMYTQQDVDVLLQKIKDEKDEIITKKEETISQLTASMASMYTQDYLDNAIIEAEKRGELKYDINGDGKVGLEEVIKYLETLSGVRVESLIIFPGNKKHFLLE
ncbi:hypothetical protein MHK_001139 [Candidatus Magnetomorum sp. HK-1]|nr:hypothetical protein MHK_001139 [Candidatus Magnetomorum sp. HK-1]